MENKTNREIKFRYWNGEEMHYSNEWARFPLTAEGEVFLQYTGLRDKNDNPIYEGDIVRIGYKETENHVVKWGVQGFWPALTSASIEVIGNVHQHPHLLENN